MARLLRVLATFVLLIAAAALSAAPALAHKRAHDKLPDRWERKYHLNLKQNQTKRDRDHDGLSNYREYRAHTNPRKKDSDHDGLRDRAELRFGFDPRDRDSDDDGIKDGKENAGRITRLSASAITIRLAAGGKLRARLGDGLAAACTPASAPAPDSAPAPGDDQAGDDDPAGDDDSSDTPDDPSADDPTAGDDDPGDTGDTGDTGDEGDQGVKATASSADDDDDAADDDTSTDDSDGTMDESDADFDRQFDADFSAGDQQCGTSSLKRGQRVHEATVDRSGARPVVTAIKLVRR